MLKQIQNVGDKAAQKNLDLMTPVEDICEVKKTPKYTKPSRPLYELNHLNNNSKMTKEL